MLKSRPAVVVGHDIVHTAPPEIEPRDAQVVAAVGPGMTVPPNTADLRTPRMQPTVLLLGRTDDIE